MAEPKAAEPRPFIAATRALVLTAMMLPALLQPYAATAAAAAASQLGSTEMDWGADLVNSDLRRDIHELSGNVRISQGEMSMEADKATAHAMQTDHSRWTFDRSVRIKTADANLTSDTASATFANGQIAEAMAKGKPATFEQRNGSADKRVRGRANTIEYDFGKGTVTLTDNVWFSQGGNEFRGDTLIYYVRDERVVMNPGGRQSGRVNITIRPKSKSKPGQDSTAPGAQKDKSESGA